MVATMGLDAKNFERVLANMRAHARGGGQDIRKSLQILPSTDAVNAVLKKQAAAAAKAGQDAYERSFGGRMVAFGRTFFAQFLGAQAVMRAFHGIKQFVSESVQAEIVLSRIKTTLMSVGGSAEFASKEMAYLWKEAYRIGFSFKGAADNYARFAVAGKAAGWTMEETRRSFSGMMEAAAVLGLGSERTSDALLALEQMLSKGKVQAEELRRQLGNAMPSAINTMARALGMSLPVMYKALETGAIDSSAAVKAFTEQVRKDFPLTDTANQTVRNLDRMANAMFQLKGAVGSLVSGELRAFAEGWSQVLRQEGDAAGEMRERMTVAGYWYRLLGALSVNPTQLGKAHNIAMGYEEVHATPADMARELRRRQEAAEARRRQMATGAGATVESRVTAMLKESSEQEKLNDLVRKEIELRDLLKEKLSDEQRTRLKTALDQTQRKIAIETAEGDVEKAKLQLAHAKARRDEIDKERTAALDKLAELEETGGGFAGGALKDEIARLNGLADTLEAARDAAGLDVSAAEKMLSIAEGRVKPAKPTKPSLDLTEHQRHGAYYGGPGVALLDVNKSMNQKLAQLVRNTTRTGGGGGAMGAANYGGG